MRPSLVIALVAAAAGCNFDSGGGAGNTDAGGGVADASGGGIDSGGDEVDAGEDGADAGVACADLLPFEPSNLTVCDLLFQPQALTLDGGGTYQLNTATGVLTDPGGGEETLVGVVIEQDDGPSIFAVFVRSFTLTGTSSLSVRGPNAFALVTRRDLVVDGALGVPASGSIGGAGGNNGPACNPGGRGDPGVVQANGGGTLSGGSGGGGGAFGDIGGRGAGVDGAADPTETDGGAPGGTTELIPLRGGCAGGDGGEPAVNGGPGGGAGGAIQLVAGGMISVTGYVTARGGGGQGVLGISGGGGGGGSGGGILIEATAIAVDGALTANGGGGGEGGRTGGESDFGTNGHDFDGARASGGALVSLGGNGGRGGALAGADGEDGETGFANDEALAGGGGGGGSVGRIHLRAVGGDVTIGPFATISPAAQ